jgi:hypothetical protein
MTTATMELEEEIMTDHQMDTILSMIYAMFKNQDKEVALDMVLTLIKDERIKEKLMGEAK